MDDLIGKKVFVRTVTHYHTGELEAITNGFLHLRKAAWIADTGRFAQALRTGDLNEVEPYPDECYVNLGAVVDLAPWTHELPREVK